MFNILNYVGNWLSKRDGFPSGPSRIPTHLTFISLSSVNLFSTHIPMKVTFKNSRYPLTPKQFLSTPCCLLCFFLPWKGAVSGYHSELLFLLSVQRRLNTTGSPPAHHIHVIILSYTAIAVEDLSPAFPWSSILGLSALNPSYI